MKLFLRLLVGVVFTPFWVLCLVMVLFVAIMALLNWLFKSVGVLVVTAFEFVVEGSWNPKWPKLGPEFYN
jgi:hypothetical protein